MEREMKHSCATLIIAPLMGTGPSGALGATVIVRVALGTRKESVIALTRVQCTMGSYVTVPIQRTERVIPTTVMIENLYRDQVVQKVIIHSFRNGSVVANFTVTYAKVDALQVLLLQHNISLDSRIGAMRLTLTQLSINKVPSVAPTIITATNRSSTSILLRWTPVPHGAPLKGYTVFYRKLGTDYQPDKSISIPANTSLHVDELEKFTCYYFRVLAFNSKGNGLASEEIVLSTDEDVPSLPPSDLKTRPISSTAIEVTWQPIDQLYTHGTLIGYNVSFSGSYFGKVLNGFEVVSSQTHFLLLRKLEKFTHYDISVCGFTSKGCGVSTGPQRRQTFDDVPSLPPPNVHASTLTSTSSIKLSWKQVPQQYIHGTLLGYTIEMQLVSDAHQNVPPNVETLKVGPPVLSTTLEQLGSFSRFKFRVAARTRLGPGVFSKEIFAETCRCPAVIYTNWWVHPPYLNKTSSGQPAGIFPSIIKSMATWACGDCLNGHRRTFIDFSSDGKSNRAEKSSNVEVLRKINNESLSFPVYGNKYMSTYLGMYGFTPVVVSPGVAFITVDNDPRDVPLFMLRAVAACFPFVALTLMMAYLAGIIIWILERKTNPESFPESFIRGVYEGFWWSFISMTTVGYGDRCPKTVPGRLFAIMWTLTGLVVMGILTGSISTALTTFSMTSDTKLYGTKIATIENSSEQRIGILRNAKVNTERKYLTLQEIYEDLVSRKVKGTLLDTYVAADYQPMFAQSNIRVNKILLRSHAYGVVLPGELKKLQFLFHDYLHHVHAASISKQIDSKTSELKHSKKSEAEEKATGIFDHKSTIFKTSLFSLTGLLLAVFIAGFISECKYRCTTKKNHVLPCEQHRLLLVKQLRSILENLHQDLFTKLQEKREEYKRNLQKIVLQKKKQLREKKEGHFV